MGGRFKVATVYYYCLVNGHPTVTVLLPGWLLAVYCAVCCGCVAALCVVCTNFTSILFSKDNFILIYIDIY